MADNGTRKLLPAYATFKAFDGFIGLLGAHSMPHQIDRSMMSTMSGSGQAAMLNSLQYLGLMDESGQPTKTLQELVTAWGTPQEAEVLRTVITQSYPFGSIDLSRATMNQLESWFREQGISGSTVDKAISFLLAAAKRAEIDLSGYLTKRKSRRTSNGPATRKTTPRRHKKTSSAAQIGNFHPHAPSGSKRFDVPLSGGKTAALIVPENLTVDDWKMLNQMFSLYAEHLIKTSGEDRELDNDEDEGGDIDD